MGHRNGAGVIVAVFERMALALMWGYALACFAGMGLMLLKMVGA